TLPGGGMEAVRNGKPQMPRWVFLLGVGIALVGAAFQATSALVWHPAVTRANARRIRPGLTLAEVKALLGRPPDRAITEEDITWDPVPGSHLRDAEPIFWSWDAKDGGNILVEVGANRRALRAICTRFKRASLFERFRAWLGL